MNAEKVGSETSSPFGVCVNCGAPFYRICCGCGRCPFPAWHSWECDTCGGDAYVTLVEVNAEPDTSSYGGFSFVGDDGRAFLDSILVRNLDPWKHPVVSYEDVAVRRVLDRIFEEDCHEHRNR